MPANETESSSRSSESMNGCSNPRSPTPLQQQLPANEHRPDYSSDGSAPPASAWHGRRSDRQCDQGVSPEGFELPGDVDQFGRFAVAYGLSFHSANLEEVRLPSELQTFREAYPDTWKTTAPPRYKPCICYSNPDCARCGGTGFLYM